MASIFAYWFAFAHVGLDGQRAGFVVFVVARLSSTAVTNLGVLVVERARWTLEHQITGRRTLVELGAAGLVFVGETRRLFRAYLNQREKSPK
jgi:hypothetical protein